MTAGRRTPPSADAVQLAEAVLKALTVPEPPKGSTLEDWDLYTRTCDYRRGYVMGALHRYEQMAKVLGTEEILEGLAKAAENDPANRSPRGHSQGT